jgi:rubrerythrin
MQKFDSVEAILDFAIAQEEGAARSYDELAATATRPGMKDLFTQFAREEQGHKSRLIAVKHGKLMVPVAGKVVDLKLSDYLVEVPEAHDLDYPHALGLAMQKEKAAFKLYTDLAGRVDNPGLKETFLALAQEEAKHKLRFELEYDEVVMNEN